MVLAIDWWLSTCVSELSNPSYAPLSDYSPLSIQGFDILMNNSVVEDQKLFGETVSFLEEKLGEVKLLWTEAQVQALLAGGVKIWVELESKPRNGSKAPGAEFHHEAQWLKENGFHPLKYNCVEIGNIRAILNCLHEQPMVLLHELSHAYDFIVVDKDPTLKLMAETAFNLNLTRGSYEAIEHVRGGSLCRAYAITNVREFFAETCESYFGMNDFFPFVRSELRSHDPESHALMEAGRTPRLHPPRQSMSAALVQAVWGKDRPQSASVAMRSSMQPLADVRSLASKTSVRLVIQNSTTRALDVVWVDFRGREAKPQTLESGRSVRHSTFSTHVFRVYESTAAAGAGAGVDVATERALVLEYTVDDQASQLVLLVGEAGATPTRVGKTAGEADALARQQRVARVAEFQALEPERSVPQHPHALQKMSSVYGGSYKCDMCGKDGSGTAYHCEQCSFDAHPACATAASTATVPTAQAAN